MYLNVISSSLLDTTQGRMRWQTPSCVTEFYRVLPSFTEFYRVLPGRRVVVEEKGADAGASASLTGTRWEHTIRSRLFFVLFFFVVDRPWQSHGLASGQRQISGHGRRDLRRDQPQGDVRLQRPQPLLVGRARHSQGQFSLFSFSFFFFFFFLFSSRSIPDRWPNRRLGFVTRSSSDLMATAPGGRYLGRKRTRRPRPAR